MVDKWLFCVYCIPISIKRYLNLLLHENLNNHSLRFISFMVMVPVNVKQVENGNLPHKILVYTKKANSVEDAL